MSQAIHSGVATSNLLSQTTRENKGDALGKTDFLLLLVTQFKHQDPLNPMDDKEFVAQLAQFSSLEQLMNMNESIGSLATATREQMMMNAAGFIGKDVVAGGNGIAKTDEGVSVFYYAIGEDMTRGSIYVYDVNMNQIYGENLPAQAAGTDYKFEWNGKNYAGADMPNGVYYVRLTCENANGEPILVDTAVSGRVETVFYNNGETYLKLDDGRIVALSNLREIAAGKASTNTDNTGNTDNSGNGTDAETDSGTG
jgi:flagellar basal-body rod modification protein FlgD